MQVARAAGNSTPTFQSCEVSPGRNGGVRNSLKFDVLVGIAISEQRVFLDLADKHPCEHFAGFERLDG